MENDVNYTSLIDRILGDVRGQFSYLYDKSEEKLKKLKKFSPSVFIIIFVMSFSIAAYQTIAGNPFETADIYDGATNIAIAQLPFDQIYNVLQNEQNFTLFYYIVRVLVISPLGMTGVKLFLFGTWVLSLYLFYKCLGMFIKNKQALIVFTSLYSIAPTLVYYASYPRMYGVINMLMLLLLLVFNKYLQQNKLRYLLIVCAILIILPNLHLMSAFVAVIAFAASVMTFKTKGHVGLVVATLGVVAILCLVQIVQKPEWKTIYFGRGVDYMEHATTAFYLYPQALIMQATSNLSWIFYLVFVYSLYYVVKTKGYKDKRLFFTFLFVLVFMAINMVSKQFVNYRHFIFFVAPLLVYSFYGLYLMRGRIHFWLVLTYITYFVFIGFASNTARTLKEIEARAACKQINTIETGVVVSDYYYLNFVRHCLPNFKGSIIAVFEDNVELLDGKSDFDILVREATIAGYSTHASYAQALAGSKLDLMNDTTTVKYVLEQNNIAHQKVYLINTLLNRKAIYFYEDLFMKGLKFNRVISPSILEYDFE